MTRYRPPIVCRCGRMTHDWLVVDGLKLCPECAWDESEVKTIRPQVTHRPRAHEYVQPRFTIRRVD